MKNVKHNKISRTTKLGKCSNCSNKAIIELKYLGKSLCRNCFMNFFERRVRKTMSECGYLKNTKNICVALSGGKDSVVVLHILNKLSKNFSLFAITIDGGIKGHDDKLLKNAQYVCKKLDVKHYIFSFKKEFDYTIDDLAKVRPGACNCGIFRRYLLNKKSRELGADKLATGHNLDDEVESIIMNTIRGDVEKIMRGDGVIKHEKFVPRIKPLQRCPEDEVALYAKLIYPTIKFGLQCPYRGVVLRADIKRMIDELEKNHPGTKFQIFEGNKKIRERLLATRKVGTPNTCKLCGEICSGEVCQACDFKEKIDKMLKK